MNGNPFIPQVEQYNAVQDIVGAFMTDYKMRLQRESQVMSLMKQLDPVQLMNDELRMNQYKEINEIEDYVTGLMKQRKGRLSSEDMFDIQYRLTEFEKSQNENIAKEKGFEAQMSLAEKEPGRYEEDVTKVFNWVNDGIYPADGRFIKLVPKDLQTWTTNWKPYGADRMRVDDKITYSPDGKLEYNNPVRSFGPEDQVLRDQEIQTMAIGQWMTDDQLRLGTKMYFDDDQYNYFTGLTSESRQEYVRRNKSSNDAVILDDPVLKKQGTKPVPGITDTPEFLWFMENISKKVQQPQELGRKVSNVPKYQQPPTGEGAEKDKELLPVELSSGENAKYEMEQKFGTHEKQKKVEVTFVPEKIEQPSNKVITVGGGGGARKLTARNDMLIAEEYALGVSVGDANRGDTPSGIVAGAGYKLTQSPQVERRIKTYMGDAIELQDVGIEELGGKKYWKGETEAKSRRAVKFSKGMKISEQLYKRLEDMSVNGEEPEKSQAKIILDQIKKADVVNWSVLYGSPVKGETMVLSELFTPELAKEFNMEYIPPEDIGQTAEEPKEEITPQQGFGGIFD